MNNDWDLVETFPWGTRHLKFFPNGYGISAVRYSDPPVPRLCWEVTYLRGTLDDYSIDYDHVYDVLPEMQESSVWFHRKVVSELPP